MINDKNIVAQMFADYFSNIGETLDRSIPRTDVSPLSFMPNSSTRSFFFRPTSSDEVTKLIASFPNKGCHINEIPIYIFKRCSHILAPIISRLFDESVGCGVFPTALKKGRIVPIHKKGSKATISNYRPICTLPILSKIFEKLAYVRINTFLTENDLLSNKQFGFRKGLSTSDALLEFLDNVYHSFNESHYTVSVFLDFSKAFDTVNLDILLNKLNHMGFRGICSDWLKTYLRGRIQYVDLDGTHSSLMPVRLGVPQGSTLGPLLFLVYINDMNTVPSNMEVVHFADDTTLYMHCNHFIHNHADQINHDLMQIDEWLCSNRLSINIEKTSYMVLSNRLMVPDLPLELRNIQIKRTDTYKFLGVQIDANLKFHKHIDDLCNKLSRNIGVMTRISQFLPQGALRSVYLAIISSHVNYGITTWGSAGASVLSRLKSLMNRAIRRLGLPNEPLTSICIRNRLLNFDATYKFFVLMKMYNITIGASHEYFYRQIAELRPIHSYPTRFIMSDSLNLPLYFRTKCQNSFLYRGIKLWNKLPLALREEPPRKFKPLMRSFVVTN